jgi:hypothetical protein
MKKIAIFAVCLVAVGLLIMLIGVAVGITPLYVDSTGIHARTQQPEIEDYASNYSKSAHINLSLPSDDVIITSGEKFGYTIEGTYYEKYEASVTSDSLTITLKSQSSIDFGWSGPILFGRGHSSPRITVYVPRDMTVSDLDLSLMSGDLRIENIKAQNIKLDGASGNITVRNLTVENTFSSNVASGDLHLDSVKARYLKIDGASGNIKAENLAVERKTTLNLMSGDVFISGVLLGETSFDGASGNLTLEIDGRADDYSWNVNGISPELTVRDNSGDLGRSSTRGDNQISLDVMSGEVSIRFLR